MAASVPKPKANHKVQKNETIEKIAKKYGFSKVKDIWDYPKNAKLKKLRKDPKKIEPGDIVVIPAFNDKERKEIGELHKKYLYAANMEKLAAARFAETAKAELQLAAAFDRLGKKYAEDGERFLKEYIKSVSKAKAWSDGVDVANMVIGIVSALKSLATKSIQASETLAEKGVKEFEKVYQSMVADSKVFMYAPLTSEATKQTGKALTNAKYGAFQDAKIFAGQVIESYGKWTSPSFYGQALVIWSEKGKTWNDAATFDLQRDAKETIARMRKENARIKKLAADKAAAARQRAKTAADASAKAKKMQKVYSDKAKGK